MPDVIVVSAPGPQGPAGAGGAGGVTDGDKGDITVASSGTSWTIDNDAVTFAKMQNVTGPALVGRQAATSGDLEAITLGTGLTIDGSKQLSISASYAQQSVTMTAGTGLTGGGDLSANRTFAVAYGTTSGTACQGNDSRLSDARTPTAHTHALADIQQGGATSGQVLEWSGSAWAPATLSGGGGGTVTSVTGGTGLTGGTITASGTLAVSYGSTAGTACEGNDSRLSDARTPTAHAHAWSDITSGVPSTFTPSAHTHDVTDAYVGHIDTPTAKNYTIDLNVAAGRTVTALYFITASGTVDVTVKNGANTIYTADGLGTTKTSVTSGLSNATFSAGGTLTLTIDAVSTPSDLQFSIVYSRTTGAIS